MSNSFTIPDFVPPVRVELVSDVTKEQLLNFRPFNDWLNTLLNSLKGQNRPDHPFHLAPYSLRSIKIQSVTYFGPTRLGFVKLHAVVRNESAEELPGLVFLRGGAVAVLMILRPRDSPHERWVIMTQQPRPPAGSLSFLEIPTGLLDDQNSFVGAAAKAIKEETGFSIRSEELIDMTELAMDGSQAPEILKNAVYSSPGSSDDYTAILLWEKQLDRLDLEDLRIRLMDHQLINLRVIEYERLIEYGSRDAKTLAALLLYEHLKRIRKLA